MGGLRPCLWIVAAAAVMLGSGHCRALTTPALEEAGLSFEGYLEAEVSYTDEDGQTASDVAVSELTLGAEYVPVEWLQLVVVLIYEDGDEGVGVDEAYVGLGGSERLPLVVTVGRLYLPMGAYSSVHCSGVLCSDSLTQLLTESREDVVQACCGWDAVALTVGVANGDVDEAGHDDTINVWYAAVEAYPAEGLAVGAAYTSSLADSDELAELMPDEGIARQVGAASVYVIHQTGPFYGSVEYAAALERFDAADLDADHDDTGDRPRALNVEAGYDVLDNVQIGARYGWTAEWAGFPEDQYGAAVHYFLSECVVLSIEVLHGELPAGADEDSVIGRVAVEF
jgi:hypothetical protein